MITKIDIVKVAIQLFERQGVDFQILEVAKLLKTSKRTVYEHFKSKNELITQTIDYVFDDIKRQHEEIILEDICTLDKLKKILAVYPQVINLRNIKMKKIIELYPKIYKQIDDHFVANWELTLDIFDRCKESGSIKNTVGRNEFRLTMLGIFENVIVYENHEEMLRNCIDIVFGGIAN